MDVVEWIEKNMKKIARWLDGQEKQKDGQMDIKNGGIGRKKMDVWIDKTNRQIWLEGKQKYEEKNRWMVGWTGKKQKDGWMDRKKKRWIKMDYWIDIKMDGWMDIKMDGWMDSESILNGTINAN